MGSQRRRNTNQIKPITVETGATILSNQEGMQNDSSPYISEIDFPPGDDGVESTNTFFNGAHYVKRNQ